MANYYAVCTPADQHMLCLQFIGDSMPCTTATTAPR
jgi:hypothetical protein